MNFNAFHFSLKKNTKGKNSAPEVLIYNKCSLYVNELLILIDPENLIVIVQQTREIFEFFFFLNVEKKK